MPKYWKIILPLLFALAVALGFLQRKNLPDFSFGSKTKVSHFTTASTDSLEGYYQKSQEIMSGQNMAQTVSFLAVGDIMLSRNVAGAIKEAGDPLLPFHPLSPLFQSVDFSFGNLESPFVEKNPIIGGHLLTFAAPKENVQGLAENKFKILNLANNHAMDQDTEGLGYTIKLLKENNIQTTGANPTSIYAWEPGIVEQNGLKICFVGASYASINDGGKTTNPFVARIDQDPEHIKSMIAYAKAQCDFTVVTMHAGTEYVKTPNQAQIKFAHLAIDAGADMVIGAHPHWVQTIEKYQNKYIFYSLGNFIFDQMWSQETKEGLTLKIAISKSGCSVSPLLRGDAPNAAEGQRGCSDDLQGGRQPAKLTSIELLPVIIENYSTPRAATAEESKKILNKINQTETVLYP